ncbi:Neprilysin [Exaiptasia diaphana]|nr:Neprilysin [Exaiptasia diaphana]
MESSSEENLMEDCEVYYKRDRPRFTKPFAVTVVVCIILSVLCTVLAILYAQAHGSTPEATSVEKPGKKYKLCNDDRCFQLGKAIVHSLNQSADPCKDFYAYACGGWQEKHPLQKGKDVSKVINLLSSEIQVILKFGLENAKRNYSKNVAVMKTARFYKSCKNTTAIESSGIQPLIKLIEDYGGWSIFNNTDSSISIESRIGKAARELDVDSLIVSRVTTDFYNSSNKILMALLKHVDHPTRRVTLPKESKHNTVCKLYPGQGRIQWG